MAPFLKWPGGKRRLLPQILPFVPQTFGQYIEPFAGGAAMFFALNPQKALLSDLNSDLISCYVILRDNPEALMKELNNMRNSEVDYYRVRASSPRGSIKRAARFIYLCRLSFNGIHRYNQRGQFNVPYGYKSHLTIYDPDKLLACSARLQSAKIKNQSYLKSIANAKAGDLLYIDPPYTVAHNNNGFVKYNATIFSWKDQIRLAEAARRAAKRGCSVIVSNADHFSVSALYTGFNKEVIRRPSVIASSAEYRKSITESIFWLHPS